MPEFSARLATADEIADWDSHVTSNPNGGNVLQSTPFAEVKQLQGWRPVHLVFEGPYTSYNLVLEKAVPGLGSLWYMIKGPGVAKPADVPDIADAAAALVKRLRLNVFAVKVEPDVVATEKIRAFFTRSGLVKTFNIQPNDSTALLDVSPEPEELLKNLHSRGRNAVRRAIREGVEVHNVEPTEGNFRAMFELMGQAQQGQLTATLRSFEYYRTFWRKFVDAGFGRLLFVYEDGQPSVGAFVIKYGCKGTYKDGGSTPRRSQYGDSHLLQWTAINQLKELGVTEYDFCGTPPAARRKDKDHPQYGLGLFKTSFTKTVTDFAGCHDRVISPVKYRVWSTVGERVARQVYWRKHHQPFY
ncbi:lipid II:glycine glycyltransferase FemX [Arthrobacter sp. H14]|uniref:lipid II:glycine glycyltransferase FemX n=1 Tax=Arthrobacter sp. H14 TaxID=1312959 RepID=UPI00047AC2CA|nr:peptidoglycan bridge formation glycyltransferase FemA/FemB family protein [Arthrobacter sp. H14]